MLNMLAVILQLSPSGTEPSPYVDNASIWRHMSDALHQSLYRVLSLFIAVLPGILAFFVALAIFTLVGMAISAISRRVLALVKFDDRIARNRGNVEWTPSSSPTGLVAR